MPYSPHNKTEIASMALAHLGHNEISDYDTATSESARQVRLHWNLTRDAMLREHPWNFSIKRVALVQSTTPVSGYGYSYLLPTDFLKILVLNDADAWDVSDYYAIESELLLTDETSATIRYVSSVTDTTKWDPVFIEAFSYILASKMATKLAEAPNTAAELKRQGQFLVGEAMKHDANENKKADPSRTSNSRFVNSRGRGVNSRPDLSFRGW